MKIQYAWKKHKFLRVVTKIQKQRTNTYATTVKKYLKGHLSRKKIYDMKIQRHLIDNIDFFEQMRDRIQENSVLVIVYYWRQYLRRKKGIVRRPTRQLTKDSEKTTPK